jgi:hypothetical protein
VFPCAAPPDATVNPVGAVTKLATVGAYVHVPLPIFVTPAVPFSVACISAVKLLPPSTFVPAPGAANGLVKIRLPVALFANRIAFPAPDATTTLLSVSPGPR